MTNRLNYGPTAKVLHWLIVVLLLIQFPIGWFCSRRHEAGRGHDVSRIVWDKPLIQWRERRGSNPRPPA
jgi:cytochrome b561